MLLGYARVSTNDQETATQVAALKAAGCERGGLIARRLPAHGGTGPNSTGSSTKSAKTTCSLMAALVWRRHQQGRKKRAA